MGRSLRRKLAAILCADVAGYSRLMSADEEGTLDRLRTLRRELVDPTVATYGGRIVGTAGDSVLVEFPSVVAAVECAVEVQEAARERSLGVPEEQRMLFRVGINLGEVIEEGDDLYGEGINIAARLQELAEPGGVCISADVRRETIRTVDLRCVDMGRQRLKNLEQPVRVYRVLLASQAGAAGEDRTDDGWGQPSIAVLPFENMSGDPSQEYFVDGITEDLITALSTLRHLAVIARNSTFVYKDQPVDVARVAGELGVRYVLEGSVRKAGGRVRVTAQLIDATTGRHIWAQRFDRDLEDVFELQDELTEKIVASVDPAIGTAEAKRAIRKPSEDLDAWDHLQRGIWHSHQFRPDQNKTAQEHLLSAIDLDPGFALAHAWLSLTHFYDAWLGWTTTPDESLGLAYEAAKQAVALDEMEAMGHAVLGVINWRMGRLEAASSCGRRSLELSPNHPLGHLAFAGGAMYRGRHTEAIEALERLVRLSPNDPWLWNAYDVLAAAYYFTDDYPAAVRAAEAAIGLRHRDWYARLFLVASLAKSGDLEGAQIEAVRLRDVAEWLSPEHLDRYPFQDPDRDVLIDGLHKAEVEWIWTEERPAP
jgi:adenylate cyclase